MGVYKGLTIAVGVASYNRPYALKLCLKSLSRTGIVNCMIVAIDAPDPIIRENYHKVIQEIRSYDIEVTYDVSVARRGSAVARNNVLDLAEQVLKRSDILVLYDDDYVCPGAHAIAPVVTWLQDKNIGLVGGKVINLRKRRKDPDFYLNIMPGLADAMTKLTGFTFLDTKHGPRIVEYTTPLMATRAEVIAKGVRYDPNYKGTGYREETDFQRQIRKTGYKIIYEPYFYVFHLCLENGGNRVDDVKKRFYWKARNHVYYIIKNNLGLEKLILSCMLLTTYAILQGPEALKALVKGFQEGIIQKH